MRALVVLLCVTSAARADPYARDARVAHLGRALAALRAMGADGRIAFEHQLHDGVRVRCRQATPTTACLSEVAQAVCGGDAGRCAAADVVLANEHAASDLVDEQTRMKLVRTSSDYHAAILRELDARFGLLAAELVLADGGDVAAGIDRFCAERDRQVHRCEPGAKACVPDLPWQRCAAGLVWYVVTHGAQP